MKRRHFIQFASSALATIGLSQLDIQRKGLQYAKVLAQGTPRKIALLVGINAYPEEAGGPSALNGCLTDVDMQKELLIHRFKFNEKDVVTLKDQQATRDGIITTFEEHLIKQVKPGDVVVFHYSGHGSQVVDPDGDNPDGVNGTLVPIDSLLPEGFPNQGGEVLDITGHSLFLLMKAVNTEYMTAILDSCHSESGTRGNVRIRSREGGKKLLATPKEAELQETWLSSLNLSRNDFVKERREGVARGVVIYGAKRDELAADAPFGSFSAGVFSYVLTQYLWQQTSDEAVKSLVPNVSRSTTNLSRLPNPQQPGYESKPRSNNDNQPLFFLESSLPPAEGVIRKVEGDQLEVWLGGVDPESVDAFGTGAVLTLIDEKSKEVGEIQLETREGLGGKGKLTKGSNAAIKSGTIVQEKVRSLPDDFKLIIGLDPSLNNDTTAAKQALEKLPRTTTKPLQQGVVNYILGRMTEKTYKEASQSNTGQTVPSVGTIGLFSFGGDPIPGSFGPSGESMDAAVTRLTSKLKSLLAAQIVKNTLNADSSKLNITVSMSPENQTSKLYAEVFPTRGSEKPKTPIIDGSRLPLETAIQFQVTNNESSDLYLTLLVIDPTGEMTVVFPNAWATSDDVTKITAGQTLLIPDSSKDTFRLVTQAPKGTTEVLIIASKTPLKNARKGLQSVAASEGARSGLLTLSDPVEIMDSLLSDLDEGTRSRGTRGLRAEGRAVDVTQFATMSITFEVV